MRVLIVADPNAPPAADASSQPSGPEGLGSEFFSGKPISIFGFKGALCA